MDGRAKQIEKSNTTARVLVGATGKYKPENTDVKGRWQGYISESVSSAQGQQKRRENGSVSNRWSIGS